MKKFKKMSTHFFFLGLVICFVASLSNSAVALNSVTLQSHAEFIKDSATSQSETQNDNDKSGVSKIYTPLYNYVAVKKGGTIKVPFIVYGSANYKTSISYSKSNKKVTLLNKVKRATTNKFFYLTINGKTIGTSKITLKIGTKSYGLKVYTVKKTYKQKRKIKLSVYPKSSTIEVGKSVYVKVKHKNKSSYSMPKFTSTNKTVATIDKAGKVKGIKAGSTYIKVNWKNKSTKIKIVVKTISPTPPGPGPEPTPPIVVKSMQEFAQDGDCGSLSEGEQVTLTDTRNGQEYTIRKLADDNCWMVNNLSISDITLTSEDSDLPSDATYDLRGKNVYGPITNQGYDNPDHNSDHFGGRLYNFVTAAAGWNSDVMGESSDQSICPKGWTLPTGGTNGQFNKLYLSYPSAGRDATFLTAISKVLSGDYNGGLTDQGNFGYLWSSTLKYSNTAYVLNFYDSSYVDPKDTSGDKTAFGASVRCVLRTTL